MLGVLTYLFYLLSKPNIPSSQQACNKKLALQVWLAAVAPLNSGSHRPQKSKNFSGTPLKPSLVFVLNAVHKTDCGCKITLFFRIVQIF